MDVTAIKQRFEIIGTSPLLDRALDIAAQVAATDLSVLVTGETGVGKEFIPKIIHANSVRKHGHYFAINCGAIPEGTIDSELFGHLKGSFTGAHEDRKGYFEVADGGTLFLDEVAELPLSTQVRLLRALETGEFIRVGSSKVQKTDVRVIAATNINLSHAIKAGKFREDLYYRLNTVPILVPPLRERPQDIHLLFRKFAADFAEKYKMPVIRLANDARNLLEQYRWPGNVRQLKNVAEQLSVLEQTRQVSAQVLARYLPADSPLHLPVVYDPEKKLGDDFLSERDILYKILFQLRADMDEMKKQLHNIMNHEPMSVHPQGTMLTHPAEEPVAADEVTEGELLPMEVVEESQDLSLNTLEKELIVKVLQKNKGHRKSTAKELGIAERTLYRKIKEYEIE
ncbi:MAG: sigma-54 dependent transcriptional regulator [Bacteroidales bacterium]|nr:sigma-54 dependent transcriptional regulator [Bacteroidales bacterium]MDD3521633.1 sigma-54 dependent transcriptional regulator [Bacteroidales bacterium]MDD4030955.1 sigma-54 dependent transcriptional regulator [Bacteroidales bacterium]MDD4435602.1 sigma-54 dependent transcriptional regulator [Bacteroidales bacterium]MDD5732204.1 sigma-54 dependent transcriptional regulator [Bacteroidales bacterium]